MSQKSKSFQDQYENAIAALENEDTEILLVVTGTQDGKHTVVLGDNEAVEKPHDHIALSTYALQTMATHSPHSINDFIDELSDRMGGTPMSRRREPCEDIADYFDLNSGNAIVALRLIRILTIEFGFNEDFKLGEAMEVLPVFQSQYSSQTVGMYLNGFHNIGIIESDGHKWKIVEPWWKEDSQ